MSDVTHDGKPIAHVTLASGESSLALGAKERLMEHLRSQRARDIRPWTREELYEDE